MAVTPAGAIEAGLEQARLIAAMYADAEAALLERIAARVGKDLDNDDGDDWAAKRLAEVTQLRKEAESIVRRLEAAAKAAAQRRCSTRGPKAWMPRCAARCYRLLT
ncbi:phage minor capsid protein [Thermocatellispora tengchongensis]|uniref:phage minor capsid protein n=1 Tax=Thermocatellispora tengchongensis TaxID=1073253 RepID=UPI00362F7366